MQNMDNLCLGCMGAKLETDNICPTCGYDNSKLPPAPLLVPRTILRQRYIVGKVLKTNGEGATYLGFDTKLHAAVRIREYLPEDKVGRDDYDTVICAAEFAENFEAGLTQFIELARKLARVGSLGAILKVYDVFEENGTCYYISEHIETIAFREFLLRNGGTLKWSQLQPLLSPVITTLAALHEYGIIHRGISPETLTISRDGKMRIVDFSIENIRFARSAFKPQLYPGYAAIEQYGFDEKANESTDIYAVAAVIYRTLVGNPPPEATIRVSDDDSMAIPAAVVEATPTNVLESLVNALQILPEDRTQSTKEFKAGLFELQDTMQIDIASTAVEESIKKSNPIKTVAITAAIMIALIIVAAAIIVPPLLRDDENGTESDVYPPESVYVTSEEPPEPVSMGPTVTVPDFIGRNLVDILDNPNYITNFTIEIADVMEHSDTIPAGAVIRQSNAQGEVVALEYKIILTISLGPAEISIPNVAGQTREAALLELWNAGFLFSGNIIFQDVYDTNAAPQRVIATEPPIGTTIASSTVIEILFNSRQEPAPTPESAWPNHPTD